MQSRFASSLQPPFYMAVLTSQFEGDPAVREFVAAESLRLAALNSGFLGAEQAREKEGFTISVSFWASREAFDEWHQSAFAMTHEELGIREGTTVFKHRALRLAKVEHVHEMSSQPHAAKESDPV